MDKQLAFDAFANATDKQIEALDHAAEGLTSKQIAIRLDIAPKTVDQRLNDLRAKLDGMPRNDLMRLYRDWKGTWGQTPYHRTPLTPPPERVPSGDPQSRHLLFEDVLAVDGRARWDRQGDWLRPGIKPSDLGTGKKVGVVLAGAIALAILASLVLSSIHAIGTLVSSLTGA